MRGEFRGRAKPVSSSASGGSVSDVFISYAREDRSIAQSVAKDLEARGYRVWWDVELVGSDDFQDVILAALAQARAVVVIWTKASIKSAFVRDEARYALHYKKLVATRAPGVDVLDIPFGFQSQHTDDVDNSEQIVKAVTKLGAAPAEPVAATESLDTVMATNNVDELLTWLEGNPTHENRHVAFQRVRLLVGSGQGIVAKGGPESIARMSNLAAFLAGLTFRMPRFQLSAQGRWSSIGFSLALVVLLIVGLALSIFGTMAAESWLKGAGFRDADATAIAGLFFVLTTVLLSWLAKSRFASWVGQRNFAAAWIVAPLFALIAGMTCFAIAVTVWYFATRTAASDLQESLLRGWYWVIPMAAGGLLAFVYMVRKARSAR